MKEDGNFNCKREDVKCLKKMPDSQAELEKRLLRWIISNEKSGVMLDGHFIKACAVAIAEELSVDLKFSNGWLQGFKARHDLKYRKAHGEKKSADYKAAEEWRDTKWPELKLQYKLEDIYNADETGLFYRGKCYVANLPVHYVTRNLDCLTYKDPYRRIEIPCHIWCRQFGTAATVISIFTSLQRMDNRRMQA